VISLYTGAGGLDLGFEAAGFRTRVAVELDPDAVKTLQLNRQRIGWEVIHADIHSDAASSRNLLRAGQLSAEEADVLIGGPPCQPFSKSGYWARGDARRLDDPRSTTLGAYLRVLEDTKPKAFLLENVPGLTYSSKDEGVQFLRRSVDEINKRTGLNYSFSPSLLTATSFGVPQERQRVFIVGHRDGVEFRFPEPIHGAEEGGLEPIRTSWDAIGDLADDDNPALRMTGKWADLLPTIPEGMNYLYHTDRGEGSPLFGWRRRYWSFLLKLAKARPSWTIAAQPGPAIGPFHWRNRRLSARELCRLQTFPDWYEVNGTQRAIQRQLGNAVPSALAEVLALEMRAQFFGDSAANKRPRKLVPPSRGTPPPPESPAPLPAKYRQYVGEHEAHPGTGKGPGALSRVSS
jgi:DNA (cytosine-5)-methyltransferase 1